MVRVVPLGGVNIHSTLPLPSIDVPLVIPPRLRLRVSVWPIKSHSRGEMGRLAQESMTIGMESSLAEVSSNEFGTPS